MIEVVNVRQGFVVNIAKHCDVYIGRPDTSHRDTMHYGNPFTHLYAANRVGLVQVPSRGAAVVAFSDWLEGTRYQDVEPERRQWILDHLDELKNKRIGCWCAPMACHGDVLKRLAER